MAETELPWIFTVPLEREGIPYMVVGAYAAIAFGVWRTTNDLDLVLALGVNDAGKLARAFPDVEFYRPPGEVIVGELMRPRGGHMNFIHQASGYKADCYPAGTDELQAWGLRNRRRVEFEGRSLWIAPPELVILKKLEFFREGGSEKHITDIRGILAVTDVDREFVESHVARIGLKDAWVVCQPPGG